MAAPELYNQLKLDRGEVSSSTLTELVREWQINHSLTVDGKLGKKTAASVKGARLATFVKLAALDHAIASIGEGEVDGNNKSYWLDWVRRSDGTGRPPANGPWCASVLSCWFTLAIHDLGAEGLIPWKSSRHARTLGRFLKANAYTCEVPEPGAIGIYARGLPGLGQGHARIFESYDPDGDDAVSIDGNLGSFPSVVKRVYHQEGAWRRRLVGIYTL